MYKYVIFLTLPQSFARKVPLVKFELATAFFSTTLLPQNLPLFSVRRGHQFFGPRKPSIGALLCKTTQKAEQNSNGTQCTSPCHKFFLFIQKLVELLPFYISCLNTIVLQKKTKLFFMKRLNRLLHYVPTTMTIKYDLIQQFHEKKNIYQKNSSACL